MAAGQGKDEGGPDGRLDLGPARTEEQLAEDADVVRRQAGALRASDRATVFHSRTTELVRSRRRGATDEVVQFDVVEDGTAGGTPVVQGALLVRAELAQRDAPLYKALVAEVGDPQERLDGRLHQLAGRGVAAERLVQLSRRVRSAGHEVSLDHVVPLGVVCKGDGGPAMTRVAPPDAPKGAREQAVRVVVIDTGAAVTGQEHRWQAGLGAGSDVDLLDAYPLPDGDGRLDASAGHGAFAAGIVQQVDPRGAFAIHRALDSDGIGSEVEVAAQLLRAVRDSGAEVVNLSLGTQTLDDQPLLALQVAFELLTEGGHDDVLLVAAAGNFGTTRPCWPAASRRVVAVAALTARMEPADWSSRGHWVDVSTVGEGLVSTYVRGQESEEFSPDGREDLWPPDDLEPWAVWTGTSFAAPQVAAEVARRLTDRRTAGETGLTPRQVLAALLQEGRRLPDYGVAIRVLAGTATTR